MPTVIEINNPNVVYCKALDIHCPCKKCPAPPEERKCLYKHQKSTDICRHCRFILSLYQNKTSLDGKPLVDEANFDKYINEKLNCPNANGACKEDCL
jgi:hypothetical protein